MAIHFSCPSYVVSFTDAFPDHKIQLPYKAVFGSGDWICAVHENGGTFDSRLNELAHWRAEYNGFDVAVVSVNNPFIGGNTF